MDGEGWARDLFLLSDVSAAQWVVDAVRPWGQEAVRVESFVPPVFEAYARVLPPAHGKDDGGYDDGGVRWRWPRIAERTGAGELTATSRFRDVAGPEPRPWTTPVDGGLEAPETAALARVLSGFTTTPAVGFFCMWDGSGEDPVPDWWDRLSRVRMMHRDYHLLTGPVTAAVTAAEHRPWLSPNLWWPADRSWLVSTEVDAYNTFVGGSAEAIAALIADADLDAVPADPSTPFDPSWG